MLLAPFQSSKRQHHEQTQLSSCLSGLLSRVGNHSESPSLQENAFGIRKEGKCLAATPNAAPQPAPAALEWGRVAGV